MIKISKIFLFSADIDFQIISLGTGQNLSGILDGIIDRGAKTFFRKNLGGRRLFLEKKHSKAFFKAHLKYC